MVDQNKRRTIKLISGVGAAAVGGTILPGVTLAETQIDSRQTNHQNNDNGRLTIQLITGSGTPEDTVIFNNNTDSKIIIREFLPRYVVYNNQMLDLNMLCKDGGLCINPNQPVANKLTTWESLAFSKSSSYLATDNHFEPFDSSKLSGVITVDTAVVNGKALLTVTNKNNASLFS